jgi:hypothetical protein
VQELGTTRVELSVRLWFNVKDNREGRVKSRAMIRTKETLLANGFNIPNETREVLFTNALKIENVQTHSSETADAEFRKSQIQKQAVSNLAEPEAFDATRDPSPEDMLNLAETNPLPMNTSEADLLKNTPNLKKPV